MRIILAIYLLTLVGCGGGNFTASPEIPQETAPIEVVSAEITSVDIQYLYESHLVGSIVHFLLNAQARNTGTADIQNAYYRIEGESKNWWGWDLIAVTTPFALYQDASQLKTIEFTHGTDAVYQVAGNQYPKEYQIKVTLCKVDGTPLDTSVITVLMP